MVHPFFGSLRACLPFRLCSVAGALEDRLATIRSGIKTGVTGPRPSHVVTVWIRSLHKIDGMRIHQASGCRVVESRVFLMPSRALRSLVDAGLHGTGARFVPKGLQGADLLRRGECRASSFCIGPQPSA